MKDEKGCGGGEDAAPRGKTVDPMLGSGEVLYYRLVSPRVNVPGETLLPVEVVRTMFEGGGGLRPVFHVVCSQPERSPQLLTVPGVGVESLVVFTEVQRRRYERVWVEIVRCTDRITSLPYVTRNSMTMVWEDTQTVGEGRMRLDLYAPGGVRLMSETGLRTRDGSGAHLEVWHDGAWQEVTVPVTEAVFVELAGRLGCRLLPCFDGAGGVDDFSVAFLDPAVGKEFRILNEQCDDLVTESAFLALMGSDNAARALR